MMTQSCYNGQVQDRLVEILPSREPPDDKIEKGSLSTSDKTITRKELNMR